MLSTKELEYIERLSEMLSKVCDGNNGEFDCYKTLYNGSARCVNCQFKVPMDART